VQCDLKSGTRGLHVTFSSRIAQDQSSKSLNEIHAWFDRKVGGNNLEDMFYSLDSLSRRRKKKKTALNSARENKRRSNWKEKRREKKGEKKAGGTSGEKKKERKRKRAGSTQCCIIRSVPAGTDGKSRTGMQTGTSHPPVPPRLIFRPFRPFRPISACSGRYE
jgi:hypothetical protein